IAFMVNVPAVLQRGLVGDILDGHAIGSRDYRGKKGCPMRVLLIEDEPTTAKAIDTMLTTEGFNVYTTDRSEEHTSELQSLMRISYAVFCLKKKKRKEQQ